ncbi:Large cysteine-rich periplasmic protein OmcB precursor [Gemmata sp. SH-PL17]|uniref:DUF11 domain-containing protein n=1 Tax=Gemmata sp. SH-PL17 TaxID=1630693 RepID=UPI00078EBAC0|nr:DUF11 domain-containing protein [Gemmata sp. SH-PL17]AMV26621.1 Large cysteine-rich periplasmic protein OmcB precursor [Gemmata sp. SH-PL17]
MRKRPIVLTAAVAVAGLAVLGTVVAQQPSSGYTQPKVVPASGTTSGTTRPYNEWTPNSNQPIPSPAAGLGNPNQQGTRPAGGTYPASGAQPQNGVYPAGNQPVNRPRPGIAGADPVRPAAAFDIPAPSMEMPGSVTPPTRPLPPPSLSVEPGDNKFAPAPGGPAIPPATGGAPTAPSAPPFVPVPPAPGGLIPPPAGPSTPPAFPPTPVAPPGGAVRPSIPAPGSVAPLVPPGPSVSTAPAGAPLPSRVSQSVTIDAVCPDSVVFNSEWRYEIVVRNTGNVVVQNVRVEDDIPAGAQYIGSDPPAEVSGDKLVWALGSMDGATEKRIAVRVRPTEEGELRSRATVTYSASVDAKTKVTRPRLAVTVGCPEVARAGEEPVFKIKVTNSGTGPAQQLVFRALLSEGLDYRDQGKELVTKLASLPAGESRTVELQLSALKAGLQSCQVSVAAEGSSEATARASVNVVEPLLQIAQSGPAKCLVRAEPTYEIKLSNPGTAATDTITVHSVLPDGFDFVQASDSGAFNATNRVVTWKLNGLAAGGTKAVGIKLRAGAAGDVALRTTATAAPEVQPGGIAPAGGVAVRAGRVLEAKADTAIKAEGVAALRFDVAGLENPVEVGKEAVYEIRIVNQGTGACTNVQIMAALAEGTTFTNSNGPTQAKATGQTLVFEPIPTLAVKGETVYRVRVRGAAAGDQRFRVQLTCDQVRTPVVKEESTRFYKE